MKITIKTRMQLTIATLLLCSTPSYAQEKQQQELAQLQQQIQLTERQVKQQLKQLEQAEQKLQQSDRALAEAANATRQTEAEKSELVLNSPGKFKSMKQKKSSCFYTRRFFKFDYSGIISTR